MNPTNLDDFAYWKIASKVAEFTNIMPIDHHRINTFIVDDTDKLRKLKRSKDVIACIIAEMTSKMNNKPPCPYLTGYLRSILKDDTKIYLTEKEIARIWDIPPKHLNLVDLAELDSINISGKTTYRWEDVVALFN